jgi:hypothetical protein
MVEYSPWPQVQPEDPTRGNAQRYAKPEPARSEPLIPCRIARYCLPGLMAEPAELKACHRSLMMKRCCWAKALEHYHSYLLATKREDGQYKAAC